MRSSDGRLENFKFTEHLGIIHHSNPYNERETYDVLMPGIRHAEPCVEQYSRL